MFTLAKLSSILKGHVALGRNRDAERDGSNSFQSFHLTQRALSIPGFSPLRGNGDKVMGQGEWMLRHCYLSQQVLSSGLVSCRPTVTFF